MICRCLACFASNAYSCFSKAALTCMAVLKVLVTISIIVIVAVKLEDVTVVMEIPVPDYKNLTDMLASASTIISGGSTTLSPPAFPPSNSPSGFANSETDFNGSAGPFRVNASCLLQKRNLPAELSQYTKTMCSYVYAVSSISLLATFAMGCLLWCTCHMCGWGPILELSFALLGAAWWLAAALVLQENTTVSVNSREAIKQFTIGSVVSPPPHEVGALLPPPTPPSFPSPPSPPHPPISHDAMSQVAAMLQQYAPRDLRQWRHALVGLSWAMMGMFAASSVLLLVEACGCLIDCCGCVCRCCCCPDRPASRWRANLRKRKRLGEEEYVEMCGGIVPSAAANGSSGGGGMAPAVMVVARSDDCTGSDNNGRASSRNSWWR